MHKLEYSEFYITNVCNLACDNCNRFNNFAFTGHYRWDDHHDKIQQWSKILQINKIAIIGGEPTSNPDFLKWVHGVATLWPNSTVVIVSNGTQLDRWPELYDVLKFYQGRVSLEINRHSLAGREATLLDIENFLQAPFISSLINTDRKNLLWQNAYNSIKDESWPNCDDPAKFNQLPVEIQHECHDIHHVSPDIWNTEVHGRRYVDENNISVDFFLSNSFNDVSVTYEDNELTLQNSDPEKAIEACYSKSCHHFIGGNLYKCGPVGILPEFIKQFPVNITQKDRDLINAYQPADPSWDESHLTSFIKNLTNEEVIDQCKFCPESMTSKKFETSTKKPKIIKIVSV